FHPPSTTAISTLSLHDALPIFAEQLRFEIKLNEVGRPFPLDDELAAGVHRDIDLLTVGHRTEMGVRDLAKHKAARFQVPFQLRKDRKSTRLNSSHVAISYAVFC